MEKEDDPQPEDLPDIMYIAQATSSHRTRTSLVSTCFQLHKAIIPIGGIRSFSTLLKFERDQRFLHSK